MHFSRERQHEKRIYSTELRLFNTSGKLCCHTAKKRIRYFEVDNTPATTSGIARTTVAAATAAAGENGRVRVDMGVVESGQLRITHWKLLT